MAFDWTISGCSSLDCTLRISWCMLRCHIHLRFWHAGLLMIDLIALLSVLILILAWSFWSLHMHTLTTVYHSAWHVASLGHIFSWSSLGMVFLSLFILIVKACMYTWVIYLVLCLSVCCMTTLLLLDCMSLVHVGRTSIPLPPNLLVSVIPFISVLTIASVRPFVCLLFDRAKD